VVPGTVQQRSLQGARRQKKLGTAKNARKGGRKEAASGDRNEEKKNARELNAIRKRPQGPEVRHSVQDESGIGKGGTGEERKLPESSRLKNDLQPRHLSPPCWRKNDYWEGLLKDGSHPPSGRT